MSQQTEPFVVPGSRAPALLQTLHFFLNPQRYLERQRILHGRIFAIQTLIWGRITVFAEPGAAGEVFANLDHAFDFGRHARMLGISALVGEKSLLFLDGAEHLQQRRKVASPFQRRAVEKNRSAIREIAHREILQWPVGVEFPALPLMRRLAMEVIIRVVMGVDRGPRVELLRQLLPAIASAPRAPLLISQLRFLPTWRRTMQARDKIVEILRAELVDRRRAPDDVLDESVMSQLLSLQGSDALTEAEIIDLMLLLLVAGHESTASAMSWVLERVVRNPSSWGRLTRLVRSEKREEGEQWAEAIVQETLRVRPVTFVTARQANKDTVVAGVHIRGGDVVMLAGGLMQQDPEYFSDPRRFSPERKHEGKEVKNSFIPFGGGARRCLGAQFAISESATILATIAEFLDLKMVTEGDEPPETRNVTLTPARGARITVERRHT